jgi:hypothetical protein
MLHRGVAIFTHDRYKLVISSAYYIYNNYNVLVSRFFMHVRFVAKCVFHFHHIRLSACTGLPFDGFYEIWNDDFCEILNFV